MVNHEKYFLETNVSSIFMKWTMWKQFVQKCDILNLKSYFFLVITTVKGHLLFIEEGDLIFIRGGCRGFFMISSSSYIRACNTYLRVRHKFFFNNPFVKEIAKKVSSWNIFAIVKSVARDCEIWIPCLSIRHSTQLFKEEVYVSLTQQQRWPIFWHQRR